MTPIQIRGVVYRSVVEAARGVGVNERTIYKYLNQGTIDDVGTVPPTPPRACVFDGVEYADMQAAAKALGVTREAIRQRLNRRLARQVAA